MDSGSTAWRHWELREKPLKSLFSGAAPDSFGVKGVETVEAIRLFEFQPRFGGRDPSKKF